MGKGLERFFYGLSVAEAGVGAFYLFGQHNTGAGLLFGDLALISAFGGVFTTFLRTQETNASYSRVSLRRGSRFRKY